MYYKLYYINLFDLFLYIKFWWMIWWVGVLVDSIKWWLQFFPKDLMDVQLSMEYRFTYSRQYLIFFTFVQKSTRTKNFTENHRTINSTTKKKIPSNSAEIFFFLFKRTIFASNKFSGASTKKKKLKIIKIEFSFSFFFSFYTQSTNICTYTKHVSFNTLHLFYATSKSFRGI